MLRRPYIEEPVSKLAAWSGRFALFSLAVVLLSIAILRSGLLEVGPALATFAAAMAFAALAILLAFASFVAIWRQGLSGLRNAVLGLTLGLLLLAYPGYLGFRATRLPMLSDISTDTVNPPRFEALARQRPADRNNYPGAAAAQRQKSSYPAIEPLELDAPPKLVYDVALTLIHKRKWPVADAQAPVPGRRDGAIEAVSRTLIMGFRDDVVIRVTAAGKGTRVDIRSASRYGLQDFGVNAKRVAALLTDIEEAVGALPEPRLLPPPPKVQPPRRPSNKR